MRVLLDTNIIIPMEDPGRLLDENLATMRRLCSELHYDLLFHPRQYEDLARDKDETRRKIVESRCVQYSLLPSPPIQDEQWLETYSIRQTSANDEVDNTLLFTLYRNAISYLVTEDLGIHRKAKRAGCHERVVTLSQFLHILRRCLPSASAPPPAGVMKKYLYEIDHKQSFFDSLRVGYEDFDDWYSRSAEKQRFAWCLMDENEVLAICIFKEESDEVITDQGFRAESKILKLCTLKVGEKMRGQKYGERFLYTAFDFANKEGYSSIFLTTRGKEHGLLIALCEEYGFRKIGTYNGDDVLLKSMSPCSESELNSLDYSIRHYPHFVVREGSSCFLIPIRPVYHEELFYDISNWSRGLFGDSHQSCKTPERTIKKAYICHAKTKQIKPGDLLLFYRTEDRRSVEVLGVVEKTIRSNEVEEILATVSKRTVFTDEEISSMAKKECLVVLFRLQKYLANAKQIETIEQLGIKPPIQTVRQISSKQFDQIVGDN